MFHGFKARRMETRSVVPVEGLAHRGRPALDGLLLREVDGLHAFVVRELRQHLRTVELEVAAEYQILLEVDPGDVLLDEPQVHLVGDPVQRPVEVAVELLAHPRNHLGYLRPVLELAHPAAWELQAHVVGDLVQLPAEVAVELAAELPVRSRRPLGRLRSALAESEVERGRD